MSKIDQKIFVRCGSLLFNIVNLDCQICLNEKEDNPNCLIKICLQFGYSVGPYLILRAGSNNHYNCFRLFAFKSLLVFWLLQNILQGGPAYSDVPN